MRGRSPVTIFLEFSNYAVSVLESGDQLDVIYTDIRKVFDRLNHAILLQKLHNILYMYSSLLNWIQTYLHKRKQYIRISGWESLTFWSTSG